LMKGIGQLDASVSGFSRQAAEAAREKQKSRRERWERSRRGLGLRE
jgi:hypothetical protein